MQNHILLYGCKHQPKGNRAPKAQLMAPSKAHPFSRSCQQLPPPAVDSHATVTHSFTELLSSLSRLPYYGHNALPGPLQTQQSLFHLCPRRIPVCADCAPSSLGTLTQSVQRGSFRQQVAKRCQQAGTLLCCNSNVQSTGCLKHTRHTRPHICVLYCLLSRQD